ncbi:MAG: hypothetical protein KatS3mg013_0437 [Actinomycetota bacterium]|jgi:hypothetical protein|nr:MAG: hypothetical protein KatS3mg013_0437 [Actinomycetota bacterium]
MGTSVEEGPARAAARVLVARPGRAPRLVVRLAPADAGRYAALVRALAPRLEGALAPGVIANRLRPDGRLEPWTRARRRWRRRLAEALADPRAAVAVGDVAACYPSIGPAAVARSLSAIGAAPEVARAVLAMLERLEAGVGAGLPVGPAPSALLANAVLTVADRAVEEHGAAYLRWVDDVVLVGGTARQVRRALDAWRSGLAAVGLEAHPDKTRVLEGRQARRELLGPRGRGPSPAARGMMPAP